MINMKKYTTKYLLMFLLCMLIAGCGKKPEEKEPDKKPAVNEAVDKDELLLEDDEDFEVEEEDFEEEYMDETTLEYVEEIDESYIDKCIFLGDSRMVGMSKMGFIKPSHTLAQIGLAHTGAMGTRYKTYSGMDYSFKSYMQSHQASVIYICYGINGITSINEDTYEKTFKKIVENVKELEPESAIVLSSIWPVDDKGQYHATVSTELVKKYNRFLHELALEQGVYYLDIGGYLSADDGSINPKYDSGDGLHYNKEGNEAVYDYILHHPVQQIYEGAGFNDFANEKFIWENPVKPKEPEGSESSNNVKDDNADNNHSESSEDYNYNEEYNYDNQNQSQDSLSEQSQEDNNWIEHENHEETSGNENHEENQNESDDPGKEEQGSEPASDNEPQESEENSGEVENEEHYEDIVL